MKHVTLFSQLAEYQTFMGGGDGLKPNVSYVREDSKVYSTGAASEDFSGAVVYARYNITEDMSKTGLFNTSNVKALKVDGEVMEFEPEVETSGELTVLGENVSFDMENETYNVPEEYLFDNTKLSSLVVRPTNGDISAYNAVCLSISMGGMNYPMPLMFEEAEGMGVVMDYENNMIDLSPMLEMLSMYYPGNSSVCMLSVDESTETLVFGDTLVSLSGISGGLPVVFNFESAGEHELEVLLKDGESIGSMFANNMGVDYGLVEVVIPDSVKYLDEYCFTNDNNLTKVTIPESVESVGENSFCYCSSLTDVCFLGNGVKSIGSYAFKHCENLKAITLPDSIETLEYSAFYECRQLNSVKLPNGISTLNRQTFYNCVALDNVVIPDSVTIIGENCFYGCSVLKNITLPESLTSIDNYAFDGCVSLKEIYALPFTAPAITGVSFIRVPETGVLYYPYGSDYSSWKKGGLVNWEFVYNFTITECTSLSITANNVKWDETTTTIHYTATVNGVDRLGNIITGAVITGTTVSEKFEENQSDETVERVISFKYFGVTATTTIIQSYNLKHLGFTAINNSQFKFIRYGDGDDIRYSIDNGITWTALPSGELTPLIKAGESIFWKSTIAHSADGIGYFDCTENFKAHGNVMSLLYGDNFKEETSLEGKDCAFKNLFKNCSHLIDASTLILPATTLANSCYYGMFRSCYNLTTAPSILPATTLADNCYYEMFDACMNLTTAPELPATTLAKRCYHYMFFGCSDLTTAPELPATTLADSCYYNMFTDCTSLTTAPELPATTLAENCYQYMFLGCTSLTTAPELPATTLTNCCYFSMFSGCTSLTTAPELPATTMANECYYNMFTDCTSLTTAPELPATTLADTCYGYMFSECTSLTTAPELPTTTLADKCYVGMFSGCTSLTTAPELPATTLADSCYHSMFEGCTSLTTAPELPASKIKYRSYHFMFEGCTNLNHITMLATDISESYNSLDNWVNGVSSTGTFVKHPDMTSLPTGINGIPEGWTVEDYQG